MEKQIAMIKYDITEETYNKVGNFIESDCTESIACKSVIEDREQCAFFRVMMNAILSGKREVEIDGLPRKEIEEELLELPPLEMPEDKKDYMRHNCPGLKHMNP